MTLLASDHPGVHSVNTISATFVFRRVHYRGLRLARERQVNTWGVPTRVAIEESVNLVHEVFNRVFRKVPEQIEKH